MDVYVCNGCEDVLEFIHGGCCILLIWEAGGGGDHVHNMFGLRNLLFFIVCLIYCSCVACEECKRTRITLFWSLSGLGMHGCLRISGCKLRFSIFLDLYEKMHAHLWSEKFASKLPTCPWGRRKIMKCLLLFVFSQIMWDILNFARW